MTFVYRYIFDFTFLYLCNAIQDVFEIYAHVTVVVFN